MMGQREATEQIGPCIAPSEPLHDRGGNQQRSSRGDVTVAAVVTQVIEGHFGQRAAADPAIDPCPGEKA
jgi:hypothetical protein